MELEIKFNDAIISEEQAQSFAYNMYSSIQEYMDINFEEFFIWNIKSFTGKLIMTIDGILYNENNDDYSYDLTKYENQQIGGDYNGCSNIC